MSDSRRQFDEEQAAEAAVTAPGVEAAPAPVGSAATLGSLARAHPAVRRDAVNRLQRSAGNASIARLLRPEAGAPRTETRMERYAFNATIRRAPASPAGPASVTVPAARSDAPPGAEHGGEQFAGLFEALGAGAEASAVPLPSPAAAAPVAGAAPAGAAAAAPPVATPEPAAAAEPAAPAGAEAPFTIPDIEVPALAELGKSDSIGATFTYSGSIARGGAAPSGFGVTRSFSSKLTGITITPSSGAFGVSATYEHPITYQVRTGTGPRGQVDIASDTDGDITKTNYPTVVSDLTPNMSDLNGRPPRTKFWAEDLTLKHEIVHADDDKANGPAAMATVKTWLETQTATNEAGVRTHLAALPGRFASALLAALSTEDGEKHAYGDGAPSYTARANAVKTKGDAGGYP